MRYLHGMHLEHAIRHGKTVEQFLGGFDHEGEPAIRYLSIRFQGAEFWLHLNELFDQGTKDYIDLYSFDYLELPDPFLCARLQVRSPASVVARGLSPCQRDLPIRAPVSSHRLRFRLRTASGLRAPWEGHMP